MNDFYTMDHYPDPTYAGAVADINRKERRKKYYKRLRNERRLKLKALKLEAKEKRKKYLEMKKENRDVDLKRATCRFTKYYKRPKKGNVNNGV